MDVPVGDCLNPEWGRTGFPVRGSAICSSVVRERLFRPAVRMHETRVIGGRGEVQSKVMQDVRVQERTNVPTAGGRWTDTMWRLEIVQGCNGKI